MIFTIGTTKPDSVGRLHIMTRWLEVNDPLGSKLHLLMLEQQKAGAFKIWIPKQELGNQQITPYWRTQL